MKNILVTGCAGFIGSNFVSYFLEKYEEYTLINLDALTYAGDMENLKEVTENKNHKFIKGDIRDRNLVENIFKTYSICGVIHFVEHFLVKKKICQKMLWILSVTKKNLFLPCVIITTNFRLNFLRLQSCYCCKSWETGGVKSERHEV